MASPGSAQQPPAAPRHSKATLVQFIVASVLALFGLLAAVLALSGFRQKLFAIIALSIAPLFLLFVPEVRAWRGWGFATPIITTLFVVLVGLVWSGVFKLVQPARTSGATSVSRVAPAVSVRVLNPAAGDPLVTGCLPVRFEANPPPGFGFVVVHHGPASTLYYYQGHVRHIEGTDLWEANSWLSDEPGMRLNYELRVVLVPADLRDYLASSREEPGVGWWSNTKDPPDSRSLVTLNVTRSESWRASKCQDWSYG